MYFSSMIESQMRMNGLLRHLVGIFVAAVLFTACSPMHYVKVNYNRTERIMNSLYRENKNAFCITSTYMVSSTVWTYEEDMVVVYRLKNGRIREKQTFQEIAPVPFSEDSWEEMKKELSQECPMELDGDLFGAVLEIDHTKTRYDYPVDINCMIRGNYDSLLLKRLVSDIISYSLWDVDCQ